MTKSAYSLSDCPWFQKDTDDDDDDNNQHMSSQAKLEELSLSPLMRKIKAGEFANNTSKDVSINDGHDNPWNVEDRKLLISFRSEIEKEFHITLLSQEQREFFWSTTRDLFKGIWGHSSEPAPDETLYLLYEYTVTMWRKGISFSMELYKRGVAVS